MIEHHVIALCHIYGNKDASYVMWMMEWGFSNRVRVRVMVLPLPAANVDGRAQCGSSFSLDSIRSAKLTMLFRSQLPLLFIRRLYAPVMIDPPSSLFIDILLEKLSVKCHMVQCK